MDHNHTAVSATARDMLKLIAILAMTLDHISLVFLSPSSLAYCIFQGFGNWTIVIMCFFLSQGLKYTRSIRSYLERIIVWASISQLPFSLLLGDRLNVMFTLFISLLVIYLFDN